MIKNIDSVSVHGQLLLEQEVSNGVCLTGLTDKWDRVETELLAVVQHEARTTVESLRLILPLVKVFRVSARSDFFHLAKVDWNKQTKLSE